MTYTPTTKGMLFHDNISQRANSQTGTQGSHLLSGAVTNSFASTIFNGRVFRSVVIHTSLCVQWDPQETSSGTHFYSTVSLLLHWEIRMPYIYLFQHK